MQISQTSQSVPEASGARPPVFARIAGDCDRLGEVVRNGNAEFLQLGKGRSSGIMSRLDLNSLTFLHAACSNHTLVRGGGDLQHSYTVVPLLWSGDAKWNGHLIECPTLYHSDAGVEYFRTGKDLESAALIFDHSLTRPALLDWTGGMTGGFTRREGESLAAAATPGFLDCVRAIVDLMDSDPGVFAVPGARQSMEHTVTTALFQSLWNAEARERPQRPLAVFRRIVRGADDYLQANESRPVYLLDLCVATGVSARTLETAFRTICDMPPMRYLRQRRLRLARRLLRSGDGAHSSVKAVALNAGFWDLSRFSGDYRRHFGEFPSETLRSRPAG